MGLRKEAGDSDVLTEALKYAEFGWHVFPCTRQKKPMWEEGYFEHGCLEASTDRRLIEEWWARWPGAAVGIASGPSGLVVIDHDPKHDPDGAGKAALLDLIGAVGTRQSQTGSGGRHWYFKALPDWTIHNSAGRIGPGVDVRGQGGYVIAPPSENEDGPYQWLNGATIQPLPRPLAEKLVEQPTERPAIVSAGEIREGARNETLTRSAGRLRRQGFSPLAIEAALLGENQEKCSPPLDEAEVRAIAHGILRYEPGEPIMPETVEPIDTRPAAELLAVDSVRVLVTTGKPLRAAFTFSEMVTARGALNAQVAVSCHGAPEPYQQRINLESSSSRTELRRELDTFYGKEHGWPAVLNSVWNLARETFLGQDRSTALLEMPLFSGARWLCEPLLPAEGTTVFFGDGSSSKSYLALALAIAGVTRTAAAGLYPVTSAPVLYVDYEDSAPNFRRRASRVLAGLGLEPDAAAALRYWRAGGVPLREQADAIRRACDQNGIGWVIVDSAAPACGGPPEDAESALGYFAGIARIGRPCLTIAHIVKTQHDQSTMKPWGSVFWANEARRTWYVERVQEEESDEMVVGLYCRKVNDGKRPAPVGIRVLFDGEDGPVVFSSHDLNQVEQLHKRTSAQNQIWAILTEPMTTKQIAELTGIGEPVVRNTLTSHPTRFCKIGSVASDGGRPANLWCRLSLIEEPF